VIGATYLNYAGLAPLRPRSALAGVIALELFGNTRLPGFIAKTERLREEVATWIGVRGDQVAFLASTTQALQSVALSLPLEAGDVVLYPEGDFPSNVLVWEALRRGGVLPLAVCDWSAPFPPRTRAIAISTVDFTTGSERPWREVCVRARADGIWTVVDAIQSAGVKPSFSDGVDFWAAGVQKWLVSGLGLALLVVSDRGLTLEGPRISYLALQEPPRVASGFASSARRFEMSGVTPGPLLRFASTLALWKRMGAATIEREVRARRDYVHERLIEMGYAVVSDPVAWSGIVSLDPSPRVPSAVVQRGYRRRIVMAERGPYVRLSPHLFTRYRELDRALDFLWKVRSGVEDVG